MKLLLQFFCGGITVVGMTSIARFMQPKYAGMLYALPTVLIVSAMFVFLGQGLPVARETVRSTLLYSPTLIVFAGGLFVALGSWEFWSSLAAALVLWSASAVLTYLITR